MNKRTLEDLKARYIFARKLRIGYKDRLTKIDDLIKFYESELKKNGIDIEEMLKSPETKPKQKGGK